MLVTSLKEEVNMSLKEEFENMGNWLFRWRSYLPLFLTAFILLAMPYSEKSESQHIGGKLGEFASIMISFLGLSIRCYTIGHAPDGTSGGNTRRLVAHILNTSGAYSIVRHPLYLGNFFIWLGVSTFIQVWWLSVIFSLIFWIYYERIMFAEEVFLSNKFGKEYDQWARKTPAFFPNFRYWKKPELPFSSRKVLRREYSPFFAIISIFTSLKVVGDLVGEGTLKFDWMWIFIFSFGFIIYTTLRTLKKKTHLLDV